MVDVDRFGRIPDRHTTWETTRPGHLGPGRKLPFAPLNHTSPHPLLPPSTEGTSRAHQRRIERHAASTPRVRREPRAESRERDAPAQYALRSRHRARTLRVARSETDAGARSETDRAGRHGGQGLSLAMQIAPHCDLTRRSIVADFVITCFDAGQGRSKEVLNGDGCGMTGCFGRRRRVLALAEQRIYVQFGHASGVRNAAAACSAMAGRYHRADETDEQGPDEPRNPR
jgi:hypothetical protein